MKCYERFLNYIQIETTSNPKSKTHPSTESQKRLGSLLVKELKELGIKDAHIDNHGYVYATIPKNCDNKVPTLGFIAHLDTSPDLTAKNIKPKVINYDGKDIILNKQNNIVLEVKKYPILKNYQNQNLIVTDGTTLLGADDKAGIAEIMTMVQVLQENDIKHGTIKIAFTPDEEIGEGALLFDVEGFGCDFAYTIDGDVVGSIEYENFNAAQAYLEFFGVNIHPGSAKGKMINSIHLAQEFHSMLPTFLNPAFTEGYEGFNHLTDINGTVEKTSTQYIIRNHNKELFENQKQEFIKIANYLNEKYGANTCTVNISDTYYNMVEYLKNRMDIVDIAKTAIKNANLEPIVKPIRGGTDGAVLTYKGLMCPNIGTGGHNFHGRYEFITIEAMDKTVEIILNIIKEVTKK